MSNIPALMVSPFTPKTQGRLEKPQEELKQQK